MHRSLIISLVGTAIVASLATYVTMQHKLTSNHPLSLDEQLAEHELTDVNRMLLTDILEPAFGSVLLVGVAETNNCTAFEKGCFGEREFTEEEFATYTGRGPQLSLFVYQLETPATASNVAKLKTQLNTGPYTLREAESVEAAAARSGVSSLYDISVSANIGETQIHVVIRPLS